MPKVKRRLGNNLEYDLLEGEQVYSHYTDYCYLLWCIDQEALCIPGLHVEKQRIMSQNSVG